MDKVIAWLVAHGVPQVVADDVKIIEGHAKEIVMMLVMDGKDAVIAFIAAEKAKVLSAITASPTATATLKAAQPPS
jgi:hypothetical protein